MNDNIWVIVQYKNDVINENTLGLINEAVSIRSKFRPEADITGIVVGHEITNPQELFGSIGVDKIICIDHPDLEPYNGEIFTHCFSDLMHQHQPSLLILAQSREMDDLAPRLAASIGTVLLNRVVDIKAGTDGVMRVVRPTSNDFLYEAIKTDNKFPLILSFLPTTLNSAQLNESKPAEIIFETLKVDRKSLKTQLMERTAVDPESLGIEESDYVMAVGRGVETTECLDQVRQLAHELRGNMGGTRPLIDRKWLPFEQQIGQTGKTISPKLLINCGISGANEYTTGIEKSQNVIAIDRNPSARIFRFSDLGLVGDVNQIIPLLVKEIQKAKEVENHED